VVVLCVVLLSADAFSKPPGPALFCASYPDSPLCAGTLATCNLCHTSTSPGAPQWNSYGFEVLAAIAVTNEPTFELSLPIALAAIEEGDADDDEILNLKEIELGSQPGDKESKPEYPNPAQGEPNPWYSVGEYDFNFAWKRVMVAYCGRSPSYEENLAFADAADPYAVLHSQLDQCLSSLYWRDDAVKHMADAAIRAIDFGTSWKWDYRLFQYVMTGDRDMRDLLLADYHVQELDGELAKIEGAIPHVSELCDPLNPACGPHQKCVTLSLKKNGKTVLEDHCVYNDGGQSLVPERRAGMITTYWFHFYNTMFAKLPRQTAAQFYRAYMGFNIAKLEGLLGVSGEPKDYDYKGVAQAECAQCHTTLDPLAYPFAYYNGILGGATSEYDPNRPVNLGLWGATVNPQGVFMHNNVVDLMELAKMAAQSDQFKRQVTLFFYRHAIGHDPRPEDSQEFTQLWQSLPENGYSPNKLNHQMIDLLAFGVP
jgi:hypothetical protein